jgi:peptidoglycan hydrolase CwlO-like protein
MQSKTAPAAVLPSAEANDSEVRIAFMNKGLSRQEKKLAGISGDIRHFDKKADDIVEDIQNLEKDLLRKRADLLSLSFKIDSFKEKRNQVKDVMKTMEKNISQAKHVRKKK